VAPLTRRTDAPFGIATGSFVCERDDWRAALGRARDEGWRRVELTAITEDRFDALPPLPEGAACRAVGGRAEAA
jgi:hypothetical protein